MQYSSFLCYFFQESFREGLLQSAEELKRHVLKACDDFESKGPYSNAVQTEDVRNKAAAV